MYERENSDEYWEGYDKVGVYIWFNGDSGWLEFNDAQDGESGSYGYEFELGLGIVG